MSTATDLNPFFSWKSAKGTHNNTNSNTRYPCLDNTLPTSVVKWRHQQPLILIKKNRTSIIRSSLSKKNQLQETATELHTPSHLVSEQCKSGTHIDTHPTVTIHFCDDNSPAFLQSSFQQSFNKSCINETSHVRFSQPTRHNRRLRSQPCSTRGKPICLSGSLEQRKTRASKPTARIHVRQEHMR